MALVSFGATLVAIALYSLTPNSNVLVNASVLSWIELVGPSIVVFGAAAIVLATVQRGGTMVDLSTGPKDGSPATPKVPPHSVNTRLVAVAIVLIVIIAASIGGVLVYLKDNPQNQISNGVTTQ